MFAEEKKTRACKERRGQTIKPRRAASSKWTKRRKIWEINFSKKKLAVNNEILIKNKWD